VEGTVDLENGKSWTINPVGGTLTIFDPIMAVGALDVGHGTTLTINGAVDNAGLLTTNGSGAGGNNTLNITGMLTNEATGTFTLNGPTDMATIGSGMGTALDNSGTVNVDGGSTLAIMGDVTNSGTIQTDPGHNTITITGMLTNSGSFTLNGPMDMATVGSLSNSGTVDLESGSSLTVNGTVDNSGMLTAGANGGTGGNTITIAGVLTNESTGTFQLNGPNDMATIGTPAMPASLSNAGTVDLENGSSLTVNGTADNSGTLGASLNGGGTGSNTITITGELTNEAGATFQLRGPRDMATIGNGMGTALNNSGTVNVDGDSTLTIKGAVDNFGTIQTDPASNTITITGALTNEVGARFILNGPGDMATIDSLTNYASGGKGGAGVDVLGSSTLTITHDATNSGTVDVVGSSTLTIGGDLTNSGTLTDGIFCGNLKCPPPGAGPGAVTIGGNLTNSGTVVLDDASSLTIKGNFDNSGTLNTGGESPQDPGRNTVTVTGMLTNEATGQINLGGFSGGDVLQALAGLSNNGVINVNNGSSILPPFLNNLGTVNIDGTSKFVVGVGNPAGQGYIQLAGGTLGEVINGYGPCGTGNCGLINVTGSALLAGTLDILLKAGFNPTVGSEFTILTANPGQLSGTFANILNDIFNGGTEMWAVNYDYADGLLELTAQPNGNPVPEPATLLVLLPGLMAAGYGLRRRLSK